MYGTKTNPEKSWKVQIPYRIWALMSRPAYSDFLLDLFGTASFFAKSSKSRRNDVVVFVLAQWSTEASPVPLFIKAKSLVPWAKKFLPIMIPNLSTIHKLTIQFKFFGFQWLKKTLNCLSLFDENYSPCCKKQRMANDSSNFTSSPHNDNKKLDFFVCVCMYRTWCIAV